MCVVPCVLDSAILESSSLAFAMLGASVENVR